MRNSPYWLCSMLVPLSILSIMKSYLSGYKSHLASLVTFLLGWAHFSVSALFVWSMGPPGPHGSLPLMAFPFGLSGNFLTWLGSFLSERSLCVGHGPSRSSWVPAPYGLPIWSLW